MKKMQTVDVLRTQGIMARGYGIIPQLIARDERLTPEAKSIYCYFSSFAGAGFEPVFPSRSHVERTEHVEGSLLPPPENFNRMQLYFGREG